MLLITLSIKETLYCLYQIFIIIWIESFSNYLSGFQLNKKLHQIKIEDIDCQHYNGIKNKPISMRDISSSHLLARHSSTGRSTCRRPSSRKCCWGRTAFRSTKGFLPNLLEGHRRSFARCNFRPDVRQNELSDPEPRSHLRMGRLLENVEPSRNVMSHSQWPHTMQLSKISRKLFVFQRNVYG